MRTLLIDDYDSYTFNLFHLLAEVNGEEPSRFSTASDRQRTVPLRDRTAPSDGPPARATKPE